MLETALAYLDAGLSVIPIRVDGSKTPALVSWKEFAQRPMTRDEAELAFKGPCGVAIIGGKVSGGLEILDFDREGAFDAWDNAMYEKHPDVWPKGRKKLCHIRTPSGGDHVYYRCEIVEGSQKLATALEPFTDKTGKTKTVIAETKGESGYVLAPGCPITCHAALAPYEHIEGPPVTDLPVIKVEMREAMLEAARMLSDVPKLAKRPVYIKEPGGRPGDEYNVNGPPWGDVLIPHGWKRQRSVGVVGYWRRPGKKGPSVSATTGHCDDRFHVFSTNAPPFEGNETYSKFRVYTLLNHNGDYHEAAKELRRQGFGTSGEGGNGNTPPPYMPPDEDPFYNEDPKDQEGSSTVKELTRLISIPEAFEKMREIGKHPTIKTGIGIVDEALGGGLPMHQVTIISAYTGVGKSEFARQIGRNVSKNGTRVIHVDVELGAARLVERELAQESGIGTIKRRKGLLAADEIKALENAENHVAANDKLSYMCPGAMIPSDKLMTALVAHVQNEVTLVIFDSLQRLSAGTYGDSQRLQVQNFTRLVEHFAHNNRVSVIMVAEQRRTQDGKVPRPEEVLTSGAESRSIEFVADNIIGMFPEIQPGEDEIMDSNASWERRVNLVLAKSREMMTGRLPQQLIFEGPHWGMRVEERSDSFRAMLLDELSETEGKTPKQLQPALKKRPAFIRQKLVALRAEGVVDHLGYHEGWVKKPQQIGMRVQSDPEVGSDRSDPQSDPW